MASDRLEKMEVKSLLPELTPVPAPGSGPCMSGCGPPLTSHTPSTCPLIRKSPCQGWKLQSYSETGSTHKRPRPGDSFFRLSY